jgi:cyclin H
MYDTALAHVRSARLTDAELIYTPSQIALACISLASPSLGNKWLLSKTALDLSASHSLQSTIDAIKAIITTTSEIPDVESVRAVDRRLKLCKNPEKVVGSSAYKAKQAEEEKKVAAKRNRKADEVKRLMDEEEDPFGDQLKEKIQAGLVDDDDDD